VYLQNGFVHYVCCPHDILLWTEGVQQIDIRFLIPIFDSDMLLCLHSCEVLNIFHRVP
jgi:hypothetical protein